MWNGYRVSSAKRDTDAFLSLNYVFYFKKKKKEFPLTVQSCLQHSPEPHMALGFNRHDIGSQHARCVQFCKEMKALLSSVWPCSIKASCAPDPENHTVFLTFIVSINTFSWK